MIFFFVLFLVLVFDLYSSVFDRLPLAVARAQSLGRSVCKLFRRSPQRRKQRKICLSRSTARPWSYKTKFLQPIWLYTGIYAACARTHEPQTPQSRAGWPGSLSVELVRSTLFGHTDPECQKFPKRWLT